MRGRVMGQNPDDCDLTNDDLMYALKQMKTYVDVTVDDLKSIYSFAREYSIMSRYGKTEVKEFMTKETVSVAVDTDAHKVMAIIQEKHLATLPVVDSEKRVVGVVTEADIRAVTERRKTSSLKNAIRRAVGKSTVPRNATAGDLMASPMTIRADEKMEKVMRIFSEGEARYLLVVDEGGRLLGIVGRKDIRRAEAKAK
jgi:CBS domain-containing membrane protein